MLKVFVCEDNKAHRDKIAQCVQNYIQMENLEIELALSTHDPNVLISYLEKHRDAGLYFLDVDLRQAINGIKLAELIRTYDPRGFIVFVTTHNEALPMTFKYKVEAMDFIIKDGVNGIQQKIVSCINDAHTKYSARATELQANYVFKMAEQKVVSLSYDKIIFIETASLAPRKVILHAVGGIFEYYGKLDEIQGQLDGRFFRCHKSYIINTQMVEQVDRRNCVIYLRSGNTCVVSTRRVSELLRMIKNAN